MTVYVDDMRVRATVGRLTARWSHLMADTPQELHAFAARLGLRRSWVRSEGTHREHYDVTEAMRRKALAMGAQPLAYPKDTGRYIVAKARATRADPPPIGITAPDAVEREDQSR